MPICVILVPILLFVFLISLAYLQNQKEASRPTYYETAHDFPLDELPDSAHDIRFIPAVAFSAWGRSYEFKCTESDFIEWVEEKRISHPKLSPVRRESDEVHPSISKEGIATMDRVEELLISDWNFEDEGLYFVYDLDQGRAIRWSHSR